MAEDNLEQTMETDWRIKNDHELFLEAYESESCSDETFKYVLELTERGMEREPKIVWVLL